MEMAQIYLRESTFADCEYFAVWETQPAVTQFFTIDADRDYEEVVTEFVHRQDDTDKLQLTVCLRENDKPIGRIYISNIDDHYDSLDITRIYIADPAMAFEELHCERVTLDHFTANQIASQLYLKVGFQYEGVMRHGGKKDGQYVDLHLMSMLRSEYFGEA